MKSESGEATETPPPPSPRKRKLRWGWIVIAILALVILFHQALLRSSIRGFLINAAKSVHLQLDLKLSGSVWRDLTISHLKARPDGDTPVERLDAGRIHIEYDLWALTRPNYTGLLKVIEVSDVTVDVDETRLPPLPKDVPIRFPFLMPSVFIIDRLDVNYIRRDRSVIAFDDFNLRLVPGEPGYIAFDQLAIPGLTPVQNYKAPLSFENRVLTLRDIVQTSIGELDRFSFDGSETEQANFAISLGGALLGGELTLDAKLSDANRNNILALRLSGTDLTLGELKKAFPAFTPLSGSLKTVQLSFDGPLSSPREWTGKVELEGTDLRWGDLPVIHAALVVASKNGVLSIESGKIETSEEKLNIAGSIQMPPTLKTFDTVTGAIDWDGSVGALERFTGGN